MHIPNTKQCTRYKSTGGQCSGHDATTSCKVSAPYTLHSLLCTIHPAPHTLHSSPFALQPAPYLPHRVRHSQLAFLVSIRIPEKIARFLALQKSTSFVGWAGRGSHSSILRIVWQSQSLPSAL